MLTIRFEEIMMKDDESFDEFYTKLNDIVNFSFNLSERIFESKIVKKVIRSLPEKFRLKVIVIEESKDLNTVKIEEVVRFFQTYKLSLSQSKKNKTLSLSTIKEKDCDTTDDDTPKNEEIFYFFLLFFLFFKKFKIFYISNKRHSERFTGDSSKFRKEKRKKRYNRNDKNRSQLVRCHERQSFGHIKAKCPCYKKNLDKAMNVTFIDIESNSDDESDNFNLDKDVNYMTFTYIVRMNL